MSAPTVAIVQQPPSVLDLRTGITRAAQYVAEAAEGGADLVVFPETWLTCYPAWVFGLAGWRDPVAQRWYAELLCHSVVLDDCGGFGDGLGPVREAARDAGVTVGLGVNERPHEASGSLYNSFVLIGPDGHTLNVHRKLTRRTPSGSSGPPATAQDCVRSTHPSGGSAASSAGNTSIRSCATRCTPDTRRSTSRSGRTCPNHT